MRLDGGKLAFRRVKGVDLLAEPLRHDVSLGLECLRD